MAQNGKMHIIFVPTDDADADVNFRVPFRCVTFPLLIVDLTNYRVTFPLLIVDLANYHLIGSYFSISIDQILSHFFLYSKGVLPKSIMYNNKKIRSHCRSQKVYREGVRIFWLIYQLVRCIDILS